VRIESIIIVIIGFILLLKKEGKKKWMQFRAETCDKCTVSVSSPSGKSHPSVSDKGLVKEVGISVGLVSVWIDANYHIGLLQIVLVSSGL